MSIERKRIEAERAQRLDVSDDLNILLDELRAEGVEAITSSDPLDQEARENAYRDIRAIDRIREAIREKQTAYVVAARQAERKSGRA